MCRNACERWRAKKAAELKRLLATTILSVWVGPSRKYWSGLLIVILLASSGCSTVAPPPAVVTEIVELPDQAPPIPYPRPLSLEVYQWTLMAPGHWRDPDKLYFCLDSTGYEAAARNNGQLLRFTKEVMWQLRYYNKETDDGLGRSDKGVDQ